MLAVVYDPPKTAAGRVRKGEKPPAEDIPALYAGALTDGLNGMGAEIAGLDDKIEKTNHRTSPYSVEISFSSPRCILCRITAPGNGFFNPSPYAWDPSLPQYICIIRFCIDRS